MKIPPDKSTEFEHDAAKVCEALETAEAGLDRLDFSCTGWAAGRILKDMADHIVGARKLLVKLVAEETAG
jgi:hypothetical protein